jgi:hypothetical protein
MESLNDIYVDFIAKFKIVLLFISENFGDREILFRKNQGSIQSRNFEIKNSPIKGYVFHGYGCDFVFKKGSLDIEFENDNIGFTHWSFYSFAKNINSNIKEEDIIDFLFKKVNDNEIKFNNKIYEINQ